MDHLRQPSSRPAPCSPHDRLLSSRPESERVSRHPVFGGTAGEYRPTWSVALSIMLMRLLGCGKSIQSYLWLSACAHVSTMLIESLLPNPLPQLGHFLDLLDIRSLTQLPQKTWPQSFSTVLRMLALQTGQMATFCDEVSLCIEWHLDGNRHSPASRPSLWH